MTTTRTFGMALLAGAMLCLGTTDAAVAAGADVIVGDLTGPSNWNAPSSGGSGPTSGYCRYSIGTTSCNIGTVPLNWYDFGAANPTEHPVIGQNLFRIRNGRLEQLGQAWLKHGFCALQLSLCASCSPYCGGCCDELGVGCADPYTSDRNGNPSGIGPKSQVNAASGVIIVWPYSSPASTSLGSNENGQLRARVEDVDPSLNAGVTYFVEGQYVAKDDSTAGNKNNNASYRRVQFSSTTGFPMSYLGATVRMKTAIEAWQDIDPTVTVVSNDQADGRFLLGYKVTENGNGTWHYEYAVQNLNSDRSARSFSVPVPDCVAVTNIEFHDVDYHSGDGVFVGTNYDPTDWAPTHAAGALAWNYSTATLLANRNALRWGTVYNFRFDADKPPQDVTATMNMYKGGTPAAITLNTKGPQGNNRPSCPADTNHSLTVDIDDLVLVITNWFGSGPLGDVFPPCGNGQVNIDDLVEVITHWGACK